MLAVVVAVSAFLIIGILRGGSEEPEAQVATTHEQGTVSSGASSTTVADGSTTTIAVTTTAGAGTSTVASVTTTVPETTTTLPPVRGPERLTVMVLNSTRVAGLAGRLTERLADLGYRTLDPDNHPDELETSVIWYVEGFRREAEVLAEAVPDAGIAPFGGGDPQAPLTVVLGASYSE